MDQDSTCMLGRNNPHSFTDYPSLTGPFFSPFAIQAQAHFLSYVGLCPVFGIDGFPAQLHNTLPCL